MKIIPWVASTTLIAVLGGAWAGQPAAGLLAAAALGLGAWSLLASAPLFNGNFGTSNFRTSTSAPEEEFDSTALSARRAHALATLATLADERELHRGLFEISTELVGCVAEDDARIRFAAAVRRYWDGATADLMVWNKGTWRSLGNSTHGLPPVLDHPIQLPTGLGHEGDLVLDLSPGVTGRAALIMRRARTQPSLAGRSVSAQVAIAEILRGQLTLSLRRVMLYSDLQALARVDPLTTTHRRWYGESRLKELVEGGEVVAVAMVDIDRFKLINDRFGHSGGDLVLTAVGKTLVELLRTNDLVCRWGGEEFLVLLPDTPPQGAELVANRLRQAVAELRGLPTSVTVSIGIAACAQDDTPFDLVARVDEALYRAKNAGRDRVVMAATAEKTGTLRITSRKAKDRIASDPGSSSGRLAIIPVGEKINAPES